MTLAFCAIFVGLALLVWSADRLVEGAASIARHLGMPALLIGMVIVGFGTSAPEIVVSAIAASEGNPGIALGNAYGSNITNIALILGVTALLKPITMHSLVLRRELPVLLAVTALGVWQLWDSQITRTEAGVLLLVFTALMTWTIWQGMRHETDALGQEMDRELQDKVMPVGRAVAWLVIGLVLLIGSSRLLVWGAVDVARAFGVSDLIIGLTIIALGTSLPELAASIIATRKGEDDIALGNILGSNLFNTLAVVGIAGSIAPISVAPEVMSRDVLVMCALSLSLFIFGFRRGGVGRINRLEGSLLLSTYVIYMSYLVKTVFLP